MLIMMILVLLVPAMIGTLLYEKFRGREFTWVERIELLLVFAFLINLGTYVISLVRGWELIVWTLDGNSAMNVTGFVVQYMVISLVESAVLAYVFSLVRIGKSRSDEKRSEAVTETDTEPDES